MTNPAAVSIEARSAATVRPAPELLAPAGDHACLSAAIENGADAVYFGLTTHNARARAANFELDELPSVMATLHQRGVRGYVALNTLAFPSELEELERIVGRVAEAGADALIVQDLGLCRLARAVAPDLELHASTQMSITSVEGVKLAQELGCARVILARELSLHEIGRVIATAPLPVEVFVHGAICVAYSGQCLTSEALGGRSANRGECAQACRMPYQIVCDGRDVDLKDDVQYLLSPRDLAAFDLVPKLIELGVVSLKIEGRLKAPEYVASITRNYRRAIDDAMADRPAPFTTADVQEMELTFSRGFSHGFLDGTNHKVLVPGDRAKKRGLFLGRVEAIDGKRIRIQPEAPLKPGDGVVLDADDARGLPEQGGRVYDVIAAGGAAVRVGFGDDAIDLRRVRPGQRVWKTDDPALTRRLRASFEGPPRRRVALDLAVRAVVGEPLALEGRTTTGHRATVQDGPPLAQADRHPATVQALRDQIDRLGASTYVLRAFDATILGGPLVPRSLLNQLRRDLVARLDGLATLPPPQRIAPGPVLPRLRPDRAPGPAAPPRLAALCRTPEQAAAALDAGAAPIYLEFQDIKTYAPAIEALRRAPDAPEVFLATPRIEKPGEGNIFKFLAGQGAHGLLVRNAGGLAYCADHGVPFIADFALNAANELTVGLLIDRGARRVTASYDLSFDQLDDLLRAVPPEWMEVVIHQHMPMFHMEHCVFCAFLSPGTDATNCGRPCDAHDVKLRDRVGMEHPLKADVGCRNTLYNAVPQTAAEFLPRLIARGARHLRVEFLDDAPEAVRHALRLYREALDGRRDGRLLWKDLKAANRYGVTRGQLAVL